MGYTHIFLFFICLNFGLGITTVADTPLQIPSTYERCFTQINDNGPFNPNSPGTGMPFLVYPNGTATPIGEDFVGGNTGDLLEDVANNRDPNTGLPWDPILEATEQSFGVVETMTNFLTGGYITNVLNHVSMTCDLDPESPTFGEPQFPDIWLYFSGGIQVIFGFMLILTLFYWITGKGHDLAS